MPASGQSVSRRELRERERANDTRARARRAGHSTRSSRGRIRRGSGVKAEATIKAVAALHRPPLRKRIAKKLLPAGALLFSAALLVGTTLPAGAFGPAPAVAGAEPEVVNIIEPSALQSVTVAAGAPASAARDEYSVTSYAEMLRQKYGTRSFAYSTDWSGPIRWPFPFAVPVSAGYGYRIAPCRGCSSHHMGVDFTPGFGQPIYAIADGVVLTHEEGGGFGNHVYLQHTIDGQTVVSRYAHMQWGSSPLVAGEPIAVGDFIGLVGSTGTSTGAHLHLEILVNGAHVDPFAWLKQHAG